MPDPIAKMVFLQTKFLDAQDAYVAMVKRAFPVLLNHALTYEQTFHAKHFEFRFDAKPGLSLDLRIASQTAVFCEREDWWSQGVWQLEPIVALSFKRLAAAKRLKFRGVDLEGWGRGA